GGRGSATEPDDGTYAGCPGERGGHRPLRAAGLRHDRAPLRGQRGAGRAADPGSRRRRAGDKGARAAGPGEGLQPAEAGEDPGVPGPAGLPHLPEPRRPGRLQSVPGAPVPGRGLRVDPGVPGKKTKLL
ncbi:MAG: hypothetical protein AVDCRST_MAG01-01-3362, partial [uncultured Rubrobacteraceae bacterium]